MTSSQLVTAKDIVKILPDIKEYTCRHSRHSLGMPAKGRGQVSLWTCSPEYRFHCEDHAYN